MNYSVKTVKVCCYINKIKIKVCCFINKLIVSYF